MCGLAAMFERHIHRVPKARRTAPLRHFVAQLKPIAYSAGFRNVPSGNRHTGNRPQFNRGLNAWRGHDQNMFITVVVTGPDFNIPDQFAEVRPCVILFVFETHDCTQGNPHSGAAFP